MCGPTYAEIREDVDRHDATKENEKNNNEQRTMNNEQAQSNEQCSPMHFPVMVAERGSPEPREDATPNLQSTISPQPDNPSSSPLANPNTNTSAHASANDSTNAVADISAIMDTLSLIVSRLDGLERKVDGLARSSRSSAVGMKPTRQDPESEEDIVAETLDEALKSKAPLRCRVARWNVSRRFGFACREGRDILIHDTVVKSVGGLTRGTVVLITIEECDQGLRACEAWTEAEWSAEQADRAAHRAVLRTREAATATARTASDLEQKMEAARQKRVIAVPPGLPTMST